MTARDVFATLVRPKTASETVSGAIQLATPDQAIQGTMVTRAVTPKGLRAALVAFVAAMAPNPSFVIGPTNTLQVPGLWLQTDSSGVPQGLFYDDHDGAAGSNSDGQVAAGVTNPLTKPGLWLKQNANGDYIGLAYYDGKG